MRKCLVTQTSIVRPEQIEASRPTLRVPGFAAKELHEIM